MTNQSLSPDRMFNILMKFGTVESNSPKNRRKLYILLKEKELRYLVETIGSTDSKDTICRWACNSQYQSLRKGWNIKLLVKWINSKRISPEQLKSQCSYLNYNFNDIKDIFEDILSFEDKVMLLETNWGPRLKEDKWTPFDNCVLIKNIKRITLI